MSFSPAGWSQQSEWLRRSPAAWPLWVKGQSTEIPDWSDPLEKDLHCCPRRIYTHPRFSGSSPHFLYQRIRYNGVHLVLQSSWQSIGLVVLYCLPMMASFTSESTGRMFFSTNSIGPGLWAIFSLRSSARRALLSFICVACNDGSAWVSEIQNVI